MILNQRMEANQFPLPKIQRIFEELVSGVIFTILDFVSGYWQIRFRDHGEKKSTFFCRQKALKFELVSFWLMNAPSTYQRIMNELLMHLTSITVYFDDFAIFPPTLSEHLEHMRQVVTIVARKELKIKLKWCKFAKLLVGHSGHIVEKEGVRVDPERTNEILLTPRPRNQTKLWSFASIALYYRQYIHLFTTTSVLLHAATSNETDFVWDKAIKAAFGRLIKTWVSSPVLAFVDFESPYVVNTDASSVALGVVLSLKKEHGELHPIQFACRTPTSAERNYFVCERDALAVVFALIKYLF